MLFVANNLQPQRGGNESRRYGISAYDTATYHPVGHAVHLRAWGIDSVAMSPDRRRILVAGDLDDGLGTPTYDARTGRLLSKGIHDQSFAVVSAVQPGGLGIRAEV